MKLPDTLQKSCLASNSSSSCWSAESGSSVSPWKSLRCSSPLSMPCRIRSNARISELCPANFAKRGIWNCRHKNFFLSLPTYTSDASFSCNSSTSSTRKSPFHRKTTSVKIQKNLKHLAKNKIQKFSATHPKKSKNSFYFWFSKI